MLLPPLADYIPMDVIFSAGIDVLFLGFTVGSVTCSKTDKRTVSELCVQHCQSRIKLIVLHASVVYLHTGQEAILLTWNSFFFVFFVVFGLSRGRNEGAGG